MQYRLLLKTAVLAGQIMLESGGETYRVEDTVTRILRISGLEHAQAVVLSGSIIASIADSSMDAMTVVQDTRIRAIFLNRIYLVNDVSRKLCAGEMDLETAYEELCRIHQIRQFRPALSNICIAILPAFFPLLLGGDYIDCVLGLAAGILLSAITYLARKTGINSFVGNVVGIALATILILLTDRWSGHVFAVNTIITGTIMPMVPGVAITNAVRDTLMGDYISGGARTLEAFVKAVAISIGVAVGLLIFGGN
ncbi:threonine/serine exporter family protein [Parasporobacterium paucivorans]|uniref:Uncharacterized membrane protein YjjP, DUF1212 family n=1 Tax=Parasporobacterium paucivorans DSM 15970 TaxID=1122934 RepID=A0A1M6FMR9_9FIRM|nr:threonine/serine exporter family protein [Parasporobacterium paucivorans]SHI98943.1 Uncharacterized membrane protein YjjP, DUF1212 family [Parasporobacterium paucivorans DSM 15970]